MDPHAAWEELKFAVAAQDWAAIYEYASVLREWLRRGGFPPRVVAFEDETPIEQGVNKALAQTACDFLLARAVERGWPPP